MRNGDDISEDLDENGLELVGRALLGEATAEELAQLQSWAEADDPRGRTLRSVLDSSNFWEENPMSQINVDLPFELRPEQVMPRLLRRLKRARIMTFVMLGLATLVALLAVASGDQPRSPLAMVVGLLLLWLIGPWVARLAIARYREEIVKASCDNERWKRFVAVQGDALVNQSHMKWFISAISWFFVFWVCSMTAVALLQVVRGQPPALGSLVANGFGLLAALLATISVLVRRR